MAVIKKANWVLPFLLIALYTLAFAGNHQGKSLTKSMPPPSKCIPFTGYEANGNDTEIPLLPPLVALSPGDTVGWTSYYYQTNGSVGDRCYRDNQGAIHFSWMNLLTNNNRYVFYNYMSSTGVLAFGNTGLNISRRAGDGYTTLSATGDSRAAVACHNAYAGAESVFAAIDAAPGGGFFDYFYPPNRFGGIYCLWPYISVDLQGYIHMVITEASATPSDARMLGYTRSTNGGQTWSSLVSVDTLMTISAITTTSRISEKVAIVYTHPFYDDSSQWLNDVYYIESTDGITWDWANGKINITHYGPPDSLWAYTDLDAVYDMNDNLHIVWNAQNISINGGIYWDSRLLHFSDASGNINEVTRFDTLFYDTGCDFEPWNFTICKMSIGISPQNAELLCTYTSWDTSDCSAMGYANGDVYGCISGDLGVTWADTFNITNSQTPGCLPDECDSDLWPSLAPVNDFFWHLFYVNFRGHLGEPPFPPTSNYHPMLYLRFPSPIAASDMNSLPVDFSLSQNYPNPFNAKTRIDFNLENNSRVDLQVYDVTGALVGTLASGIFEAGPHTVNWDASKVASGVYYYTIKASGTELTRKMTLLK